MKAKLYRIVAAWFVLALTASLAGWLRAVPVPLLMTAGFVVPAGGFFGAYFLSSRFRRFAESRDLRRITRLQAPRITGFIFYVEYWRGRLPALFALTTGSSDITVGITALLIASSAVSSSGLWLWHVLGIAGLLISGSMAILTSPPAMAEFPLSLVPTFLGPNMLLLHLTALTTLRAERFLLPASLM